MNIDMHSPTTYWSNADANLWDVFLTFLPQLAKIIDPMSCDRILWANISHSVPFRTVPAWYDNEQLSIVRGPPSPPKQSFYFKIGCRED